MKWLTAFAARLEKTLALYGAWGLLGISALDSAGLSMPGVKDILLIYLASQRPGRAWLYILVCVIGSVAGAFVIYIIGRTGVKLIKRKPSDREMGRASRWLAKNDFLTVLIASMLPPPLPFKPVLLASGALRMSAMRFTGALLVGAVVRFGIEGWIGVHYGMRGQEVIEHNLLWICIGFAVGIVIITVLFRHFRRPARDEEQQTPTPASSQRLK